MRRRTPAAKFGVFIATFVVAVFVLAPMYWMIMTSFKGTNSAGALINPSSPIPSPATTNNYYEAFGVNNFGNYLLNSVIVAAISTILVLAFGTLAGYALARLHMRGTFTIMVVLLIISVFPAVALIPGLFMIMKDIGWLNSYQALIVPYTALNLPFAIWILRNYFLGIPISVEENARLDGAGALRTVWTIVLPMARPGVFTAGIFAFTACWQEFLMALTFNNTDQYRTIPVGMAMFGQLHVEPYAMKFAASMGAVVPIIILVFAFRKFVVSGLTSGAVKG